jgi:threonine/homoserine/homoserine lactone efflux protein
MSIIEIFTFFGIMSLLAVIPSTNVALIVTRTAISGISNGIAVVVGIILGDLFFIILSMFGLSVVSQAMGNFFIVIKYLGAIYLLCLGLSLLMIKSDTQIPIGYVKEKSRIVESFFSGFILTLGDIKAIFFYVSLFPMFIDSSKLQLTEVFIIIFVTVVSVGGIKLIYVFTATNIASLVKGIIFKSIIKKIAGGFMILLGIYIMIKD